MNSDSSNRPPYIIDGNINSSLSDGRILSQVSESHNSNDDSHSGKSSSTYRKLETLGLQLCRQR